jgi:hypothetical protein
VGAGVRAAREVVDQRHLAEVRSGAQHSQRLLAHARHGPADAHRARQDEVHLVALRPLLEDDVAERVVLFDAEVGDAAQVGRLQRREQADLRQQLDRLLGRDRRARRYRGPRHGDVGGDRDADAGGLGQLEIGLVVGSVRPALGLTGRLAHTTDYCPRKRSASMAAMQPVPAAVTACR